MKAVDQVRRDEMNLAEESLESELSELETT